MKWKFYSKFLPNNLFAEKWMRRTLCCRACLEPWEVSSLSLLILPSSHLSPWYRRTLGLAPGSQVSAHQGRRRLRQQGTQAEVRREWVRSWGDHGEDGGQQAPGKVYCCHLYLIVDCWPPPYLGRSTPSTRRRGVVSQCTGSITGSSSSLTTQTRSSYDPLCPRWEY